MREKGVLLSPSHLDAASHDLSMHHVCYQKQEKMCEAPAESPGTTATFSSSYTGARSTNGPEAIEQLSSSRSRRHFGYFHIRSCSYAPAQRPSQLYNPSLKAAELPGISLKSLLTSSLPL